MKENKELEKRVYEFEKRIRDIEWDSLVETEVFKNGILVRRDTFTIREAIRAILDSLGLELRRVPEKIVTKEKSGK